MNKPIISIVLGTYNRINFLNLALDSIRKEMLDFPHEIIIIDGGSTDGTLYWLIEQKDVILILQHNRGEWMGKKIERKPWGYFMNLGFKCAQGKYICMLSDDCLVVPGSIINGYNLFEQKIKEGIKVGAVAFYWRDYPDQVRYRVGQAQGNKIFVNHGMYLKEAVEEVEYIDERNYFFYHADTDLSLKLWKAGYVIIDSPTSYIEHYSHANLNIIKTNWEREKKDWENYLKKWDGVFFNADGNYKSSWIEKDYNDQNFIAKKFPEPSFEYIFSKKRYIAKNKIRNWFKLVIPKKYHNKIKRIFYKKNT